MGTENRDETIKIVIIGAGVRGTNLSRQLVKCSQLTQIVAVVEPNEARRKLFSQTYSIPGSGQFISLQEFVNSSIECNAAIIATMDNQHTEPALACLELRCHILIEKPLSDSLAGCFLIDKAQKETGLVVSVCHTLRYMEAFKRIKQIVSGGTIGKLIHIEHMEAIGHLRFVHNYVRGRWAREENNTFLLLHKCCHDLDFLAWLIESPCIRVSSFGSLSYFTSSNAPAGSGKRCLDDCKIQGTCLYSANRLYIENDLTGMLRDLANNQTNEAILTAVKDGPFGSCVWHADNNVVDHQVVSMEFSGGTTATCTLSGYSSTHGRWTRIQGTKGEMFFEESSGNITVKFFSCQDPIENMIVKSDTYHPEDKDIVENWLSAITSASADNIVVGAQEALRTHAIAFAAELSRKEKRVVELSELHVGNVL